MLSAWRYRLSLLKLVFQCYEYCGVAVATRWSLARRREIGRVVLAFGTGIFILWTMLMMVPATALADVVGDLTSLLSGSFNLDPTAFKNELLNSVDPLPTIQAQTGNWYGTAQKYAQDLYGVLLGLEMFLFGFQAVLFKNDLGQILSSFSFKVFTIGFFTWLIGNAQGEVKMVIDSFTQEGQDLMSQTANTTWLPHASTPNGSLAQFAIEGLVLAAAFFAIGIYGQQRDKSQAEQCGTDFADVSGSVSGKVGGKITGTLDPTEFSGETIWAGGVDGTIEGKVGGTNDITMNTTKDWGCATSVPFTHLLFNLAAFGMGMMVAASIAVVLLTLVMVTVESYIVMGAGVFFLGFAGLRHTSSFAQGYLSYAVNVGVKLFTFWLIISIESALMFRLLEEAALVMIGSFAAAQFDGGNYLTQILKFSFAGLTLAVAGLAVFTCMMMSALAYAIPNFAGSFVTGTTALSAMSVLSGTISSIASSAKVGASLGRVSLIKNEHKPAAYKGMLENAEKGIGSSPAGGGSLVGSIEAPSAASSPLSASRLPSSSTGGDSSGAAAAAIAPTSAAAITGDGGGGGGAAPAGGALSGGSAPGRRANTRPVVQNPTASGSDFTPPPSGQGAYDSGSVPVRNAATSDDSTSGSSDALKKRIKKAQLQYQVQKEVAADMDALGSALSYGGSAIRGAGGAATGDVQPVEFGGPGMGGI